MDGFAYSELTESERQVRELENVINNLNNDLVEARNESNKLEIEKQGLINNIIIIHYFKINNVEGLQKDITTLQKSLEDQEKSKSSATTLISEQVKKLELENNDLKKKLEGAHLEVADYRKRLDEAQVCF